MDSILNWSGENERMELEMKIGNLISSIGTLGFVYRHPELKLMEIRDKVNGKAISPLMNMLRTWIH